MSMEFGLVSDGPKCVSVRAPLASGWGGTRIEHFSTDMHTSRTRMRSSILGRLRRASRTPITCKPPTHARGWAPETMRGWTGSCIPILHLLSLIETIRLSCTVYEI